jgi:hypothetical protein
MTTTHRGYSGPRLARGLAALTVALGLASAVGGVAYTINAATRAGGEVAVPVIVRDPTAVRYPGEDGRGRGALLGPTPALVAPDPRLDLVDPPSSASAWIETPARTAILRASGSTLGEQVLSRAAYAVAGLCVGAGALLLRPVLLSIAQGEPFRRGNAARIAGLGGLALVSGVGWMVLPLAATRSVLARLDLVPGTLGSTFTLDTTPVVVALFALVLAEAFRRGGELARDADGLV